MSQLPTQPDPTQAARKVELIIAQLDSLPTLPRIASQLLKLTRSDEATTREVIDLIKQDQAVTARILSMARRAGSGVRSTAVTTIDKCVLLLGLEAVRSAALSVKIYEIFDPAAEGPDPQFNLAEFWMHSLAVALACERLATLMPMPLPPGQRPSPDDLFVAGLLHDIGKAALHHCLPKSYAKVIQAAESSHAPLVALERKLIGIDHAVVGKRLGQKWNLPQGVIDAIWMHHSPLSAIPDSVGNRGYAQVVCLADVLVREMRLGYSGNYNRLADADNLASALGIDPHHLDEVRRWLPDELANRAALIGLNQLDSRELYHQALKGANEELARLNVKLLARSASLVAKSKYFDLLGELSRRVRPGSRAMEVAEAVGQLLLPLVLPPTTLTLPSPSQGRGILEATLTLPSPSQGEGFEKTPHASPGSTGSPANRRVVVFSEPPIESAQAATDPPIEGVVVEADSPEPERLLLWPREGEIEGLTAARRQGRGFDPSQSSAGFALYPLEGHLGWVHRQLAMPLPLENCYLMPLLAEGRWVGGVVFSAGPDSEFVRTWPVNRDELLAVAGAAGLALRTAQVTTAAEQIAEELSQSVEACARLTDQLVRQKAMASVGLMAAGAGHELNNPLMVISGRSELLAAEEADPQRREALEQIRQNAQRASGIITELMDYAQPPAARPQKIDLPAFVRRMAQPLEGSGIKVELNGEGDAATAAWADPEQLREAVQEVLDNAQQAMAAQDSNRRITLKLAQCPPINHESQVELTVTDSGVGMEPFVLEHATDPFFSARPAGRGRGLGLARVRRLIEHNGGALRLESIPGAGTTVRICLPAAKPAGQAEAPAQTTT